VHRIYQEKEATGIFAWLKKHAPLLSPVHAAYVVVGAVFLQCAVIGMRTLAGVNKQQLAEQEAKDAVAQQAARVEAAKQPYVPPPPPLGPAFSSDEGKPLLGFSSDAIEAQLRLRQQARRMRQEEVMANNGFSELRQPKEHTKRNAPKPAADATTPSAGKPKNAAAASAVGAASADAGAPYKSIPSKSIGSKATETSSEPARPPPAGTKASQLTKSARAPVAPQTAHRSSDKNATDTLQARGPPQVTSDAATTTRPEIESKSAGPAKSTLEDVGKDKNR